MYIDILTGEKWERKNEAAKHYGIHPGHFDNFVAKHHSRVIYVNHTAEPRNKEGRLRMVDKGEYVDIDTGKRWVSKNLAAEYYGIHPDYFDAYVSRWNTPVTFVPRG